METTNRLGVVLYADDCGQLFPLSELFSTGEKLVSTHPKSSTMEVDCLFCPDCLQVAAVDEDQGMCPKCFVCPECGTTLRATLNAQEWSYSCSYCSFVHDTAGTSVEDLEMRTASGGDALSDEFDRVVDWQRRWRSSPSSDKEDVDAVPLPRVKLEALRTIRCRSDVVQRKAGIVYKPSPLPLAGDSSMRASRRAKKDSSAALTIARISLHKPPALLDGRRTARLFLELSNPLPTPLDIRLTSSSTNTGESLVISPFSLRKATFETVTTADDLDVEVRLDADENEPFEDPVFSDESTLLHRHGHLAFLIVDCDLPATTPAEEDVAARGENYYRMPLEVVQRSKKRSGEEKCSASVCVVFPVDSREWTTEKMLCRAFL